MSLFTRSAVMRDLKNYAYALSKSIEMSKSQWCFYGTHFKHFLNLYSSISVMTDFDTANLFAGHWIIIEKQRSCWLHQSYSSMVLKSQKNCFKKRTTLFLIEITWKNTVAWRRYSEYMLYCCTNVGGVLVCISYAVRCIDSCYTQWSSNTLGSRNF